MFAQSDTMFLFDQIISAYKSSLLQIPHGFGTKQTGDGRDIDVIKAMLKNEEIKYRTIVIPSQTHSTNVTVIANAVQEHILKPENTDAVVTNQKGIVLTVVTADCVPIIYCDNQAGIIGISHGGWKGTLGKISQKVVDTMIELGSEKEHITAAIGPAIGSCCYSIYGERLNRFQSEFDERVFERRNNEVFLDLKKASMLTLSESGCKSENIDISELCTSCNNSEFYSYKREGGIVGEMLTFVALL